MKEVKCDFCGKTLEKYPSQINDHNFCSLECFHKWNQGVNNPRTLKPDLSPSKDLTYILGVCLGDGSVFYVENNRSYLVELTVIEKDFALSFKRALKRIGLNPSISDAGKTVAGNDLYRVRAHSLVFYKWFNELSLDQIYEVVSQKKVFTYAFLRGLFESEGSIKDSRGRLIVVSSTEREIIEMVEKILSNLGFKYHRETVGKGGMGWQVRIKGIRDEKVRLLDAMNPCIKKHLRSSSELKGGWSKRQLGL